MNRRTLMVLAAALLWGGRSDAATAPDWLLEAARVPTPDSIGTAPAFVLLDESQVTLRDDGVVRTVQRWAVRVVTRGGVDACTGSVPFGVEGDRILDLHGWVISPAGVAMPCTKDQIADIATGEGTLYTELHSRIIDGRAKAEPGAVFGYEAESESKALFTNFSHWFQTRYPVARSRFSIKTPAGAKVKSWTFNHANIEPVVQGDWRVWELRDLPRLEEELYDPPSSSMAARIAVSIQGPTSAGRSFESWGDVATWLEEITAPQAQGSPDVTAKSRELVAGAPTRVDSLRAIARYVQSIRYASIELGIGRGGGYRPHMPQDVLHHSYGDCKDKANLMRAMLSSIGQRSYLILLYASDPDYVREEWPAALQFNHCILGIEVPRSKDPTLGAMAESALGPLLIFDPTDPTTTLGDLPRGEQGAFALVVAPQTKALTRLPDLSKVATQTRRVEVLLAADGSAWGSVREVSRGQAAATERGLYTQNSRGDYQKLVESWIGSSVGGARVLAIEVTDDSLDGQFQLDVTFRAPRIGQIVQDRLMLVKAAIVSRQSPVTQTPGTRRNPVLLPAAAVSESAFVGIPDGFAVDELPKPLKLESQFGTYTASFTQLDRRVVSVRSLTVPRTLAPADQFGAARAFFDRIRAAEQNAVVLARN